MYELSKIEELYFQLMENKKSIDEFENIFYNSKWCKQELEEDEYTDLISLNYQKQDVKHEIRKILKYRIDYQKWGMNQSIKILEYDKTPSTQIEWNRKYGDEAVVEFWKYYVFAKNAKIHMECPIGLTELEKNKNKIIGVENEKVREKYQIQFATVEDWIKGMKEFYEKGELIFYFDRDLILNQSGEFYRAEKSKSRISIGNLNLKVEKEALLKKLKVS